MALCVNSEREPQHLRYLCLPIPGRADHLHYLTYLLDIRNGGESPCGAAIRVLDVGVAANYIYPLIGPAEYGKHFVSTDIHRDALTSLTERS